MEKKLQRVEDLLGKVLKSNKFELQNGIHYVGLYKDKHSNRERIFELRPNSSLSQMQVGDPDRMYSRLSQHYTALQEGYNHA